GSCAALVRLDLAGRRALAKPRRLRTQRDDGENVLRGRSTIFTVRAWLASSLGTTRLDLRRRGTDLASHTELGRVVGPGCQSRRRTDFPARSSSRRKTPRRALAC